jgi:hypothetical protein
MKESIQQRNIKAAIHGLIGFLGMRFKLRTKKAKKCSKSSREIAARLTRFQNFQGRRRHPTFPNFWVKSSTV